VASVEEIDFLVPFKFYRDEPRTIRVHAVFRSEGRGLVAECRLTGERMLPGQGEPQVTTHFTARVRLAPEPPALVTEAADLAHGTGRPGVEQGEVYRVYFHGPAYRVLESAWRSNGSAVGLLSASLPPDHVPAERPLVMSPRLIELCFQTAGILEMGTAGRMGLPHHLSRVRALRSPEAGSDARLFAVVTPEEGGAYRARVVDESGRVYLQFEGYRTVELPGAVDDERLGPFRQAMS
jgi:polyketide synthase-like dehydratase family protein